MDRREFLIRAAGVPLALGLAKVDPQSRSDPITLFLAGDVMTGRGIDQVLPHPGDPILFEPYVRTATEYVELAERKNGPIPRPVDFSYIWGDALDELKRVAPAARIVNLETSVTSSDDRWRPKRIHYRMHPANVLCLTAAAIDCCVLANNHVLDWGSAGLLETLDTLHGAGIETAGAGRDLEEATKPAILTAGADGRVLVFGFGAASSGIPAAWAAGEGRPGVSFLPDLSRRTLDRVAEEVHAVKRRGDLVVASIHWGANWGYQVAGAVQEFAHRLIDEAGVDLIHGHSSHHPRGIEVYKDRPILYGCGDLLNDYEGIGGYERYRGDLSLLYSATLDPSDGRLMRLEIVPLPIALAEPPVQAPDVLAPAEDLPHEALDRVQRRVAVPIGLLGRPKDLERVEQPEVHRSGQERVTHHRVGAQHRVLVRTERR